jgi:hypothetical protein
MPRRSAVDRWVLALWLLAWALATGAPADAADLPTPIYHNSRDFRIPFNVDPADRPYIRQVELWVSQDKGNDWKQCAATSPEKPNFTIKEPSDGEYWFAVRTLNTKGELYPPKDRPVEPSMRVVVDTEPPKIELAPLGRRGSRAAVRWEISDLNLDPRSLVIEYQARGARDWRQVPKLRNALLGSTEWDAGTADPIRVRATVEDKAHNHADKEIDLPSGIAADPGFASGPPVEVAAPPVAPASLADPSADPFTSAPDRPRADTGANSNAAQGTTPIPDGQPARSAASTLLVASPRFPLAYTVDDAGPEGPSLVELWVTRDGGRTWTRLAEDADRVSPYPVDLGGEGTFGLWLVVQAANGLGDPPPAPGDRPQIWVEVDSSAPQVQLDPPRVGTGAQAGRVTLTWRSSDAHPAQRPVVICYRPDRPDANWQPITARIENTGSFVWNVPPNVPARFQLRVDIFDALGNRGFAETANPVIVDRTRPRGRIIGLDPSVRIGAENQPVR